MIPIIDTYKEQFAFFSALIDGDIHKTASFLDRFDANHYFPIIFKYKNIKSTEYSTPIHIACGLGKVALTDLLFNKNKERRRLLTLTNYIKKDTSIHVIIRNYQFELMKLFYHIKFNEFRKCLTIVNSEGETPFLLATKHPDPRYLELLIRAGSDLDGDSPTKNGSLELIFCSQHFVCKKFDFKNTAYYKFTGSEKIQTNFEKFMRLRLLLHSFARRQTKIQEYLKKKKKKKTSEIIFKFIRSYDCYPKALALNNHVKIICVQALTLPLVLQLIRDTYNNFVKEAWKQTMNQKQNLGTVYSFEQIATAYLDKNMPRLSETAKSQLPILIRYAAAEMDESTGTPKSSVLDGTSKIDKIHRILSDEYHAILPEILAVDTPLFHKDWKKWAHCFTKLKTKNKI